MTYIHVDFIDRLFRRVAIYAVPAKYRGLFHSIGGYYTADLSLLMSIPGAEVVWRNRQR